MLAAFCSNEDTDVKNKRKILDAIDIDTIDIALMGYMRPCY